MKSIIVVFAVIITLTLSGCATATFTSGRQFDSSHVPQIEKGKTTSKEITVWFGQPYIKSVVGADSESWIYIYSQGKSEAQSYIVKMDVKTEVTMKQLMILMKNAVVQNYTFTEGPIVLGNVH